MYEQKNKMLRDSHRRETDGLQTWRRFRGREEEVIKVLTCIVLVTTALTFLHKFDDKNLL